MMNCYCAIDKASFETSDCKRVFVFNSYMLGLIGGGFSILEREEKQRNYFQTAVVAKNSNLRLTQTLFLVPVHEKLREHWYLLIADPSPKTPKPQLLKEYY
jgi:hypothetical protein